MSKNLDNLSAKQVMEHLESEKDFQDKIVELAHKHGWMVAHFPKMQDVNGAWRTAVRYDGEGFPDLVLVRDGTLLFVECKTENGALSKEQKEWWQVLQEFCRRVSWHVRCDIWRPSMWEEIVAIMGGECPNLDGV